MAPGGERAGRGTLRVVAGEARGLRLEAPPGSGTRPTSDRVRQAVFNSLESLGAVAGARVLDAFAGSGALGVEALSRGAAFVTFVDVDRAAVDAVRANLTSTGLAERADVVVGDGTTAVGRGRWDLVVLDPPYAYDSWADLLPAVAAALAEDGVVVIESDREVDVPAPLHVIRVKRYGGTVVLFADLHGDQG